KARGQDQGCLVLLCGRVFKFSLWVVRNSVNIGSPVSVGERGGVSAPSTPGADATGLAEAENTNAAAFRPVLDTMPPPVRMALGCASELGKTWENRGNAEVPQVYQAGHLPHHRSGQ